MPSTLLSSPREQRSGSKSPAPSAHSRVMSLRNGGPPHSAGGGGGGGNLPRAAKRIIICSDGTWLDAETLQKQASDNIPSNVTRLSRCIRPISRDGVHQVVYYHYGVGTQGGKISRFFGGVFGAGLANAVREGYEFICNNYQKGDEIILVGFSRGAFTSRSIAGLISTVGVLTKDDGVTFLGQIYEDVENQTNSKYVSKYPDVPIHNKPSASDPAYARELARKGLTVFPVPIKAVGVWETVGSLGVPRIGILHKIGLQTAGNEKTQFQDTKLANNIEYAFQALALDERRYAFQPAVWEKMPDNTTTLRQVWFPGSHSNVGGGYPDQELANITLAWMVAQLSPFLDVDTDYIFDQEEANENYYRHHGNGRVRPWSFGKIYDTITGIYDFGGAKTRTPGRYYVVDPVTFRQTHTPLRDTHEYVHPCVRARVVMGGPGIDDKGRYQGEALKDWRLIVEPRGEGQQPNVRWKLRSGNDRNVSTTVLPESPLWELEKELLDYDPKMYDFVMNPPPQRSGRSSKRSSRSVSHRPPSMNGAAGGGGGDGSSSRRHSQHRMSKPPPPPPQELHSDDEPLSPDSDRAPPRRSFASRRPVSTIHEDDSLASSPPPSARNRRPSKPSKPEQPRGHLDDDDDSSGLSPLPPRRTHR